MSGRVQHGASWFGPVFASIQSKHLSSEFLQRKLLKMQTFVCLFLVFVFSLTEPNNAGFHGLC